MRVVFKCFPNSDNIRLLTFYNIYRYQQILQVSLEILSILLHFLLLPSPHTCSLLASAGNATPELITMTTSPLV